MNDRNYRLNNRKAFGKLFLTNIRELVREPMSFFFTLVFPFLFVVMFGLMSLTGANPVLTIGISGENHTDSMFRQAKDGLKNRSSIVTKEISVGEERKAIESGDVDAVVSFSPSQQGKFDIYFSQASEATGPVVKSLLTEITLPPGAPDFSLHSVGEKGPDLFEYILPGIIVMAFSSLALFGTSTPIIQMRQRGTLRMIGLTQVSKLTFIGSQLAARFLIAVVQLVILLGVAGMKGMLPAENIFPIVIVSILGVLMLFSLGYLIGGVTQSIELASGLIGGLMAPILIVSGLFMPLEFFPEWLKTISSFIPLTYFGEALRYYMIGMETSLPLFVHYLVMTGTCVLFSFAAMRTFRWDQLEQQKGEKKSVLTQMKREEVEI